MNWPESFIGKVICGDSLSVMKEMPDEVIDMVITSPPYWGLRDYGNEQIFGGDKDCEHEWLGKSWKNQNASGGWQGGAQGGLPSEGQKVANYKDRKIYYQSCLKCQAWKGQLGLEPTPEFYIEHLTEIFNEVKRVLKKEGTLWIVIGDTYFGSGCGTNDYRTPASISISRPMLYDGPRPQNIKKHSYLKPKSLCMIPERLAWSLIQNGWILRNKNIWHKRNSMPSSVTDRFSNRWEYIFLFSKSQRYFFDLNAVSVPSRTTDSASFCSPTLTPEANATIFTDNGSFNGGCFLDFSKSKVSISNSMTLDTMGYKIFQLIGFQIRIEIPERYFMVDMKNHLAFPPTSLASKFITLKSKFPLSSPVASLISDLTTTPCMAILASSIDAHISTHALHGAEIVGADMAFISGKFFIAKITFNNNDLQFTLFVWATFFSSHNGSLQANDNININKGQSGKNPGDVFEINTQPFPEAHFAVFPEKLCEKPIRAGCPEKICPKCGKGS